MSPEELKAILLIFAVLTYTTAFAWCAGHAKGTDAALRSRRRTEGKP